MILPKKRRCGSLRSTLRDPRGLCHDVGVVALWRNRYLVVPPQLRPWQELLPYRRCAPAWLLPVPLLGTSSAEANAAPGKAVFESSP